MRSLFKRKGQQEEIAGEEKLREQEGPEGIKEKREELQEEKRSRSGQIKKSSPLRFALLFIVLAVVVAYTTKDYLSTVARQSAGSVQKSNALIRRIDPAFPASAAQNTVVPPSSEVRANSTFQREREIYIPARDILTGNAARLQEQEEANKLNEAVLKGRKIENDIKKAVAENREIDFNANLKTKDLGKKLGEKINIKPVTETEEKKIPPALISVQGVGGQKVALLALPSGESFRVKEGDRVNEFTVRTIEQNRVVLNTKDQREVVVTVRLPERYPVSPSMFGPRNPATVNNASGGPGQMGVTAAPFIPNQTVVPYVPVR